LVKPVPGMFDLAHVFQVIFYRFNNKPFSEHDLFIYFHEYILHIIPDIGDQVQLGPKEIALGGYAHLGNWIPNSSIS